MFKTLLQLDTIRGVHSTGVFALQHLFKDNVDQGLLVKKAVNGHSFIEDAVSDPLFVGTHCLFMGHNRHATRGAINDENAHPFEFEHIIGAHNGSLNSYHTMHGADKYTVDSQALYSELNENGVDSMWGKLSGAASLTWYDKQTGQLHFLRNAQRPMVYAFANKGRTLVWASEDWMILVAAMKAGVDLDGKLSVTTVNNLYTFTFPRVYADAAVTLEQRSVKAYVPPVYNYYGTGNRWESKKKDDKKTGAGEHLEKQGAKIGDSVLFTVDRLNDYTDTYTGRGKCTVIGRTDTGTPIRIYEADQQNDWQLLDEMWESTDIAFTGKICGEAIDGLKIALTTVQCLYMDMDEVKGVDLLEDAPVDIPHTYHYCKKCSRCRALKKEFYLVKGKEVCSSCCTKH